MPNRRRSPRTPRTRVPRRPSHRQNNEPKSPGPRFAGKLLQQRLMKVHVAYIADLITSVRRNRTGTAARGQLKIFVDEHNNQCSAGQEVTVMQVNKRLQLLKKREGREADGNQDDAADSDEDEDSELRRWLPYIGIR